jgi:glycosyltransferase involved in cell wall biosynthesis
MKKTISFGIPCFNEEDNVALAYKELRRVSDKIKKYDYKFIFVDNGSDDKTRDEIAKLAKKDKRVVGIFLSRNFGPEASAQAALEYAASDAFIFYVCDMQDPADLIPEFIKKWEEGYNIVMGKYTKTQDALFMRIMRRTFYAILKKISNIEIPTNVGSFVLLDKKVVTILNMLPEKYRFFRGLVAWVGLKKCYIEYERQERKHGKSSYNFFGYIKHAERSFFGFSYLPLDIVIYMGIFLVTISFLFIFVYLLTSIIYGNPIKGSITILVSIIFFGGMQLLAISIIGKYIQVIVEETKSRPVYIVKEIINGKD